MGEGLREVCHTCSDLEHDCMHCSVLEASDVGLVSGDHLPQHHSKTVHITTGSVPCS